MSMLASLVRAYDRLPDAPPFGFSMEKVDFCILLNLDGSVVRIEDIRADDRQRSSKQLLVPQPWKKASGIKPNFLWENTAYALGVTAGDGRRTPQEHAAFREKHLEWLAQTQDEGLLAVRRFIEGWLPEGLAASEMSDDLVDKRLVFALANEYRAGYVHNRPAALALWKAVLDQEALPPQVCLVTGETSPIARLHPAIKGVWGAQTSGGSLVSFNDDAYESYGHKQGANSPVSEAAAFAYGTVLNRYLDRDSGHRIQIGDASTVFWADCSDVGRAEEAENLFAALLDPAVAIAAAEKLATSRIESRLDAIRNGQRLSQIAPELDEGVRFHVLGLAPNAARLSVRFYWQDDFGRLIKNFQRYLHDTAIEPPPRDGWPPMWRYLLELKKLLNTVYVTTEGTALKKDGENLVAEVEGVEKARVPMHMLTSVVAFGPILLSPALIGACAGRGISVVLLDRVGRFQARVEGPVSGNVLLRRAQYRVAPFAGAWIETDEMIPANDAPTSRPLRGGVDRNASSTITPPAARRRPLRGGVDRNLAIRSAKSARNSRPLRGGVDRNAHRNHADEAREGRPLRGGVDRNPKSSLRRWQR